MSALDGLNLSTQQLAVFRRDSARIAAKHSA
jgi:hypothetical protein